MKAKGQVNDQGYTYRPDLYYINERVNRLEWKRREYTVSWWWFWLVYLGSFWKWKRSGRAIREK